MTWLHWSSISTATFLASLVEFVEALTIVLAVATTRGWRSALVGSFAATLVLTALIAIAGPSLLLVPVQWLQLVVGALVLIFGLRWLRKATLRSAGLIPMHDEAAEYSGQVAALEGRVSSTPFDAVAFVTTFKAVFLEGLEVAFTVITAGSVSGELAPAIWGAALAFILIVILGFALRRPLTKVPENSLKKIVGTLLTAFGAFWLGEGLNFEWPLGDAALIYLAAISFAASMLSSERLRSRAP